MNLEKPLVEEDYRNEDESHDDNLLRESIASANDMTTENVATPASLCCLRWYPTHTTIKVGNKKYFWNSRGHRKMRYAMAQKKTDDIHHPSQVKNRIHFCSFEPFIVTWYICWIGFLSSFLNTISDLYAIWPESSKNSHLDAASYIICLVSNVLLLINGYLNYVESINHTYSEMRLPSTQSTKLRKFVNPMLKFGHWKDPLDPIDLSGIILAYLLEIGILLEQKDELQKPLISTQSIDGPNLKTSTTQEHGNRHSPKGYRWFISKPDWRYIGIFNAMIYFAATTIYFIAYSTAYPSVKYDTVHISFISNVLFTIAATGFIYYGHAGMAEASGSWIVPKFINIGWFISIFNAFGGYGYLISAMLLFMCDTNDDATYEWWSIFSSFLGSCLFLISSFLQCIEFSSEHPIFL